MPPPSDLVMKQILLGSGLGGFAGGMDASYIEPFGIAIGGTLLMLQLAEHNGMLQLAWNRGSSNGSRKRKSSGQSRSSRISAMTTDAQIFLSDNVYIAGSFLGAYALAQIISSNYYNYN